jgi:hypothetical protein
VIPNPTASCDRFGDAAISPAFARLPLSGSGNADVVTASLGDQDLTGE